MVCPLVSSGFDFPRLQDFGKYLAFFAPDKVSGPCPFNPTDADQAVHEPLMGRNEPRT